jgi:hypothetical protein
MRVSDVVARKIREDAEEELSLYFVAHPMRSSEGARSFITSLASQLAEKHHVCGRKYLVLANV